MRVCIMPPPRSLYAKKRNYQHGVKKNEISFIASAILSAGVRFYLISLPLYTAIQLTICCLITEFPTSEPELAAVAERFDKNRDGFIDYKEFMAALRTDIEKEQEKKSDAERIHEEVERQVNRCCCQKQFAIQKVSDNKYVVCVYTEERYAVLVYCGLNV